MYVFCIKILTQNVSSMKIYIFFLYFARPYIIFTYIVLFTVVFNSYIGNSGYSGQSYKYIIKLNGYKIITTKLYNMTLLC